MARKKQATQASPANAVVPAAEERIGSHAAMLVAHALGIAVSRVYTLYGAVLIGFAGLLLMIGWQSGPHKALEAHKFTTYNMRAPAHIVESWLAVEFDPKLRYLFLRGAREALLDPDSPPAVSNAARKFLQEWVTQPVEEPRPGQPGFKARVQLLT